MLKTTFKWNILDYSLYISATIDARGYRIVCWVLSLFSATLIDAQEGTQIRSYEDVASPPILKSLSMFCSREAHMSFLSIDSMTLLNATSACIIAEQHVENAVLWTDFVVG